MAIVEGPAGIGKSRLLADVRAERARRPARSSLAARASQLERDFPFGVVRQLFEAALADPAERARLLAGAAAPAAAVFAVDSGRTRRGDGSFAALHGLYWLALNLAAARAAAARGRRPALGRRAVAALPRLPVAPAGGPARPAARARCAAARPAADAALLGRAAQDRAVGRVRPAPLDEAAVGALVRARLGAEPDPAFRRACHATTGGNPLLLRQLLSALEADRIRPDAAHADTVRGDRLARRRLHRAPAARAPVRRRRDGRARRSPCSARTPRCPPSPRSPG